MKLVADWKDCWRWASVHAMTYAIALQSAWVMLDADMRASLPAGVVQGVTVALLVFGIAGRLVDQGKKQP